jgi:hypothetical protein
MTLARAICVARGNDVAWGHKEQRNRRAFRLCILCGTDEDPGLRIESFAVINLRGVSTNKTIKVETLAIN